VSGGVIKYPAVDLLVQKAAAAQSVSTALLDLAKAGRLGDLERDIGAMRRALGTGRMELVREPIAKSAAASVLAKSTAAPATPVPASRADEYVQKAYAVSDPVLRRGYLELAAQERQKAGAA
jgi:hypothetical protein